MQPGRQGKWYRSFVSETFAPWGPISQAFAATLFTWGLTALGAGVVFFFKEINPPSAKARR
jgi:hypothetical protein